MTTAAIFVVLPLCLAFAALSDLFTMTIPNRVSAIVLAAFLIVAPFSGLAWSEIGMSLVAGAAVFAACFALFAFNVMGGGDAKLLTAASVWYGFGMPLVEFLVCVAYVGGLLTLLILILRAKSASVLAMGLPIPSSLLLAKKVPYGIAIAIGGFMAFPEAPMVAMRLAGTG
ncbi:prepilin peptidase [Rhizobiaceae bacterium BDR2-2]|uniref:Prepilin peptidase n=1 Tax=Ectorhizobium quercum TaxID=2965071 RepID=A0AAE3MXW6_9HYPH|nr:prepilin peptidase [Ectorhizobium quercum]MCX8995685.1 prepilin peptidase [Ectorhizobium quercum]